MATSTELVSEASDLLDKAERALAKLSKRLPVIVKGVIANGDAQALTALKQMELQALSHQGPGSAYLTIVQLHQVLYAAEVEAGLTALPPPPSDDDITVFSGGGR